MRWTLLLLVATGNFGCASGRDGPSERAQAIRARLTPVLRARVAEAVVPVLLPRDVALDRAALTVDRAYTALHLPLPGLTLSLHSARLAHRYPWIGDGDGGATRALRGTRGHVTVNEGIRTATWIEDGVAHALDLECAAAGDPRCADDTLLLALVEGLEVLTP